jgi:cytochrome c-type biogenesis protein CcmH/NrfG
MRALRVALLLTAVLVFYLGVVAQRGWVLLRSGSVVGALLGVGVLVLPVLGLLFLVAELRFGAATARLARELRDQAPEDLPRRPSGRVDRAAADRLFERRRAEVEAAPEDWRGWFRLALAYDAAGDRRRARAAMRRAIALHRAASN